MNPGFKQRAVRVPARIEQAFEQAVEHALVPAIGIGDKFGDQMAIDALIAGEFLIKDAEGNQKKFRVGSGFKRFYVIRAVIHYDAE